MVSVGAISAMALFQVMGSCSIAEEYLQFDSGLKEIDTLLDRLMSSESVVSGRVSAGELETRPIACDVASENLWPPPKALISTANCELVRGMMKVFEALFGEPIKAEPTPLQNGRVLSRMHKLDRLVNAGEHIGLTPAELAGIDAWRKDLKIEYCSSWCRRCTACWHEISDVASVTERVIKAAEGTADDPAVDVQEEI